eukprot:Gregarina_sp_Poly_1__3469@NODE_2007_length_2870_cov_1393_942205_g1297_i0_p1_GENE_NODE_2007_length_2870_cov_1393_942205_g1297_i0NODE_2007_length_2870_cov_1393_942205_g1297_i0_p1_ORF_typecomplete_len498_score53_36_NODE_2007_length_2870_cov_1393_942205_g1297_i012582751
MTLNKQWGLTIEINESEQWVPSYWTHDDEELQVLSPIKPAISVFHKTPQAVSTTAAKKSRPQENSNSAIASSVKPNEKTRPRTHIRLPNDIDREGLGQLDDKYQWMEKVELRLEDFEREIVEFSSGLDAVPYSQCLCKLGDEVVPRLVLFALLIRSIINQIRKQNEILACVPNSLVFCFAERSLHPRVETSLHKAAELAGIDEGSIFVLWRGVVQGLKWLTTRNLYTPEVCRFLSFNSNGGWQETVLKVPTHINGRWSGYTDRGDCRAKFRSHYQEPLGSGNANLDARYRSYVWDDLASEVNTDMIHVLLGPIPEALQQRCLLRNPDLFFYEENVHQCAMVVPTAFAERRVLFSRRTGQNRITASSNPGKASFLFKKEEGLCLDRKWYHFQGEGRMFLTLYSDGVVKTVDDVTQPTPGFMFKNYCLHVRPLPESASLLESLVDWDLPFSISVISSSYATAEQKKAGIGMHNRTGTVCASESDRMATVVTQSAVAQRL